MTIESRRREWFDFGRVIDRALQTFRATLPLGLSCAILLVVIPEMVGHWLDGPAGLYTNLGQMFEGRFAWVPFGYGVAAAVAAVLCQAILVSAALASQQGGRAPASEAMAEGLRLLPAALGIAILTSLGIGLGLLLLVVPGLMLMTIWIVALPVQAHGRPGVIAAIQESGELTKGVRWKVFFLVVAAALAVGLASWLIGLVPRTTPEMLPVGLRDINQGLIAPVFDGIGALAVAYGCTSLFHELKWGDGDKSTAEIFA